MLMWLRLLILFFSGNGIIIVDIWHGDVDNDNDVDDDGQKCVKSENGIIPPGICTNLVYDDDNDIVIVCACCLYMMTTMISFNGNLKSMKRKALTIKCQIQYRSRVLICYIGPLGKTYHIYYSDCMRQPHAIG